MGAIRKVAFLELKQIYWMAEGVTHVFRSRPENGKKGFI